MSKKFLNAYHFVPRKAPDKDAWLEDDKEKIERDLSKIDGDEKRVARFGLTENTITDGHAIYAPGRYSGRITCEVKLECPTVIGAKRHKPTTAKEETRYAVVEPFLYDEKPAIPASSLKGLISSIAESASQSVYRVLGNSVLTVAFAPDGKNPLNDWQYSAAVGNHPDIATGGRKERSRNDKIGRAYEYFDQNALPLTITRSEVSPVDAMFGYVRNNEDGTAGVGSGKLVAVAGKLRFSHAVPSGEYADKASDELFSDATDFEGESYPDTEDSKERGVGYVRLKELGQPMKAPAKISAGRQDLRNPDKPSELEHNNSFLRSATPTMYFMWNEEEGHDPRGLISKEQFGTSSPKNFRAQGGKCYLHHVDASDGEPWATRVSVEKDRERPRNRNGTYSNAAAPRKSAVRPIRAGVTFRFHIDFDNLTNRELDLLCFALKPCSEFRHKIGMGKGVGLGSVEISPVELRLIERKERYTADGVFAENKVEATNGQDKACSRAKTHTEWLEKNDRHALNALLKIGERHAFGPHADDRDDLAETPVLWVPLNEERFDRGQMNIGQEIMEAESFKWFSNNEGEKQPQKLVPIADKGLPVLYANRDISRCNPEVLEQGGRHFIERNSDNEKIFISDDMAAAIKSEIVSGPVKAVHTLKQDGLVANWISRGTKGQSFQRGKKPPPLERGPHHLDKSSDDQNKKLNPGWLLGVINDIVVGEHGFVLVQGRGTFYIPKKLLAEMNLTRADVDTTVQFSFDDSTQLDGRRGNRIVQIEKW